MEQRCTSWSRLGLAIVVMVLLGQQSAAKQKVEQLMFAVEPHMVLTRAECFDVRVVLLDDDVPLGRATLEPLLVSDVEAILRSSDIKIYGCADSAPTLRVFLAAFHTSTWGFVTEVAVEELVSIERPELRPPLRILSVTQTYRVLRLGAVSDENDPAGQMRRTVSESVREFADDYLRANRKEPR